MLCAEPLRTDCWEKTMFPETFSAHFYVRILSKAPLFNILEALRLRVSSLRKEIRFDGSISSDRSCSFRAISRM
jgi:hypothetical protein